MITASRDVAGGEAFARSVQLEGLDVHAERCDLSRESEIRALRDSTLTKHGKLDVLFNNSVARAGGDPRHTTAADWDTAMTVNSTGLFLASQILSEPMQERRSGSIVNIASIYGMVGPKFSIYEGTQCKIPSITPSQKAA